MSLPPIVTAEEWTKAREALLIKEKEATRRLDDLAAERRRLPMVKFSAGYVFEGDQGKVSLTDVFESRRQLVVYHYMWHDDGHYCSGCASFTDNVGRPEHYNARDTTFAAVSRGPWEELRKLRDRMEWTVPFYSSAGTTFHDDCVGNPGFGLSAFLRDGDDVYRTYFTTSRGVDRLRFDFNILDLTAFGRQESWEDSPEGRPQTAPYQWWRLHDEY
jgi:predicted dithiol-disulfide oxidoreductase (DUF899 family)